MTTGKPLTSTVVIQHHKIVWNLGSPIALLPYVYIQWNLSYRCLTNSLNLHERSSVSRWLTERQTIASYDVTPPQPENTAIRKRCSSVVNIKSKGPIVVGVLKKWRGGVHWEKQRISNFPRKVVWLQVGVQIPQWDRTCQICGCVIESFYDLSFFNGFRYS